MKRVLLKFFVMLDPLSIGCPTCITPEYLERKLKDLQHSLISSVKEIKCPQSSQETFHEPLLEVVVSTLKKYAKINSNLNALEIAIRRQKFIESAKLLKETECIVAQLVLNATHYNNKETNDTCSTPILTKVMHSVRIQLNQKRSSFYVQLGVAFDQFFSIRHPNNTGDCEIVCTKSLLEMPPSFISKNSCKTSSTFPEFIAALGLLGLLPKFLHQMGVLTFRQVLIPILCCDISRIETSVTISQSSAKFHIGGLYASSVVCSKPECLGRYDEELTKPKSARLLLKQFVVLLKILRFYEQQMFGGFGKPLQKQLMAELGKTLWAAPSSDYSSCVSSSLANVMLCLLGQSIPSDTSDLQHFKRMLCSAVQQFEVELMSMNLIENDGVMLTRCEAGSFEGGRAVKVRRAYLLDLFESKLLVYNRQCHLEKMRFFLFQRAIHFPHPYQMKGSTSQSNIKRYYDSNHSYKDANLVDEVIFCHSRKSALIRHINKLLRDVFPTTIALPLKPPQDNIFFKLGTIRDVFRMFLTLMSVMVTHFGIDTETAALIHIDCLRVAKSLVNVDGRFHLSKRSLQLNVSDQEVKICDTIILDFLPWLRSLGTRPIAASLSGNEYAVLQPRNPYAFRSYSSFTVDSERGGGSNVQIHGESNVAKFKFTSNCFPASAVSQAQIVAINVVKNNHSSMVDTQ